MTILITGGGSQIGVHLAHLLKQAGRDVIFASRSGKRIPEGFQGVQLDWYNPATFHNPFEYGPYEAAYIIGPPDSVSPAQLVIPFIDIAVEKGVRRFVYCGASSVDEDGNEGGLGAIPKYLKEKNLDYVFLRPTWFTDNLLAMYGAGIREKGEFASVIPTARLPYVATQDIAKVAFDCIVNKENIVKTKVIIGPERLTNDELASIASEVLNKHIIHKVVSPEELVQICCRVLTEEKSRFYVWGELRVEKGSEEVWSMLSDEDQKKMNIKVIVGTTTVKEWVQRNKDAFA